MPEETDEGGESNGGLRSVGLFALHRMRAEVSRRIGKIAREIASAAGHRHRDRQPWPPPWMPVVPVEGSVGESFVTCLFDGAKAKNLEEHLRTSHGITPDQYRRLFLLPPDYPMRVREGTAAARVQPRRIAAGRDGKRIVDTSAANEALMGISRKEAVIAALKESQTPLSSRNVAEAVMHEAGRSAGAKLMMDVTAKLTVTLNNLFTAGLVNRQGDSYRRLWSLRKE